MPPFKNMFRGMNRDLIVIFKIILSGLTAACLIFFISALAGIDLKKNSDLIGELDRMSAEINTEINEGIDKRIRALGEVPAIDPFKKYYCSEFAKEIHDISYLTEKQKMSFDTFNVREFEYKAQQLVEFAENSDIEALNNELEIVKRELKNSANLIAQKRKTLSRQRIAFIVFFFILWIVIYIYYSRGIFKKTG